MIQNKERTALNPSVAAEGEQPLTNHNANIADGAANVNPHTVNSDKGEKPKLKTVSMTDLYNQVYTCRPPIINGLLYPGTYILAGAPKLGKSFLMAQLAYHVSTGTEMWGFQVQKGSVLYLALEDDYGRLQKRLYKMFGVDTAKNLRFGIEAPSLGDDLIDLLEGFVEDHPDTRLIIVDTLQKVRGTGDGHTYSSDYQDICRLKRFTDSRNLCLMIVHHTRKQQSEDRFDTISGTNGLLGAADGAFLLTKAKRTANDAMLDIAGRDQQDQRLHLVRNTKTLLWEMESAETELWEEEPDPLLEEVAKLNVSICPPKTTITADNKPYFQMLDALEQMDHAPVDANEPYQLLAEHIRHMNLQYRALLSLADQYYPQRTILRLAHTAREGSI